MDFKPGFEKRARIKRPIENNRARVADISTKTDEAEWEVYDRSLDDFGLSFIKITPHERPYTSETFRDYIESTLLKGDKKAGDFRGVELGGPGSKLFSGFSKGFFGRTAGICLADIRDNPLKEADAAQGHNILIGDILEVENQKLIGEIKKTLGSPGVDLIICRMVGGLDYLDHHPVILDRFIRNWYAILGTNGLMFVQFPPFIAKEVMDWRDALKKKFPDLEIAVEEYNNTICIHKTTSAPEELPPITQLFK